MKRLLAGFTVFTLLISYFAFLSPNTAQAADQVCYVFEVILTNNDSVPLTGYVYFGNDDTDEPLTSTTSLTLNPGETGTLRLAAFVPGDIPIFPGGNSGGLDYVDFSFGPAPDSACGDGFGHIDDGRINAYDLAAPLAAYCTADGGIAVWDIDDSGHGTLAFTVTKAEISKALSDAASSGKNVVVGEGLGDSLYALSTNQLTLVGPDVKEPGKTYEFLTTGDRCS